MEEWVYFAYIYWCVLLLLLLTDILVRVHYYTRPHCYTRYFTSTLIATHPLVLGLPYIPTSYLAGDVVAGVPKEKTLQVALFHELHNHVHGEEVSDGPDQPHHVMTWYIPVGDRGQGCQVMEGWRGVWYGMEVWVWWELGVWGWWGDSLQWWVGWWAMS